MGEEAALVSVLREEEKNEPETERGREIRDSCTIMSCHFLCEPQHKDTDSQQFKQFPDPCYFVFCLNDAASSASAVQCQPLKYILQVPK